MPANGLSSVLAERCQRFPCADVSIVQLLFVFILIGPLRADDFIVAAYSLASPPRVTLQIIMV